MPGSSLCSSPGTIQRLTAPLLSWSATTTASRTSPAQTQALAGRSSIPRIGRSAVDDVLDDDAVEDLQCDDGQDGAEVEPPEAGDQAAEDAQVGLADVAQEPKDDIESARIGRAQPSGKQQLDHDVHE